MVEAVRQVLEADARIAFAVLFGSAARGDTGPTSDLDVAIGLAEGACLGAADVADSISRLESASGTSVDLVVVDEAPAALAFRIFRDGRIIVLRDRAAYVRAKARAILDYLDFKPIQDICVQGVLRAAARGR